MNILFLKGKFSHSMHDSDWAKCSSVSMISNAKKYTGYQVLGLIILRLYSLALGEVFHMDIYISEVRYYWPLFTETFHV